MARLAELARAREARAAPLLLTGGGGRVRAAGSRGRAQPRPA
jgi:hypothetical protein